MILIHDELRTTGLECLIQTLVVCYYFLSFFFQVLIKTEKKAPASSLVAINKSAEWGHHSDFPKIKNKEDPDKASENYSF